MKHHKSVAIKDVVATNRNQWDAPTNAGETHAIHIIPRPWKHNTSLDDLNILYVYNELLIIF